MNHQKCQSCGKGEATVHLTDLINQEEIHLCDKCAEEQGAIMPIVSISSVLSGLIEQQDSEEDDDLQGVVCGMCGMTYEELRKGGKAGCARCYETFARGLMPFVERIQGSSEHRGKAPRRLSSPDVDARRELHRLRQQLKIAVMEEDYELAVMLRDRIKRARTEEDNAR